MSSILIKAENVSKYYRLGKISSGRLREDVGNWLRKKSAAGNADNASNSKHSIWALKNINFEVKHGEVLGFIGNNGAGKSTLLKIISRITLPTTRCVYEKGTIHSLLEF